MYRFYIKMRMRFFTGIAESGQRAKNQMYRKTHFLHNGKKPFAILGKRTRKNIDITAFLSIGQHTKAG